MRKILATFLIINLANAAAPAGYKSETSTAKTYAQDLVLPNDQLTKQAGLDSRIETGNSNILKNPSFEHSTASTSWQNTNVTMAANTTDIIDGKKSLTVTISASSPVFYQTSITNYASSVGLQGVASMYIKTATSGLQFCASPDGVDTGCINITSDNVFRKYEVPFIFGSSFAALKVKSTTASSGSFVVDNAFVGLSSPFQNVNGAKLVGTCSMQLSANSIQSAGSFSVFSSVASLSNTLVSGQAQLPSTNIVGCKFASLPAGDYIVTLDGEFGNGTSGQRSIFSMYDQTNISTDQVGCVGSSGFGCTNLTARFSYSTTKTNITFEPVAKITSSGSNYIISNTVNTIKVYYFPPESKIYSQASLDYDWTSFVPTFTGFGTVTNTNCIHKRDGSDLLLNCYFTAGTTTATEFRVSLPNSLLALSSLPTISIAGQMKAFSTNANNSGLNVLKEPSVGYVTFGVESISNAGLSKTSSTAQIVTGATYSFDARIPIQGWQDYGVIVGSFAGIEKCANDYECTDTFSAQVSSTGVVTNENLDWINGNCTMSGTNSATGTCTFNTNLKDGTSALSSSMNCVAQSLEAAGSTRWVNVRSTSSNFVWDSSNTSVFVATGVQVKCQKGSNDYKPKSAKVATSIGVPTVPGIITSGTGNSIDTFSFSYGATASTACTTGTCAYLNQIGSVVTSVVFGGSAGTYTANLTKTYANIKCTGAATGGTLANYVMAPINQQNTNTISLAWMDRAGAGQNNWGTVICMGSY